MTLFDIREGRFLCHEDLTFRNGGELTMLGVHEVGRKAPEAPVRPYLFLRDSRLEDESDREDRVKAFHEALKKRSLPHFRRTPIPPA